MVAHKENTASGAIESYAFAVIASYVRHNAVPPSELPRLVTSVFATFTDIRSGASEPIARKSVVPVSRSVTPEYLVCLEDGKKLKTLARYIRRKFNLSPAAYRAKWNLPDDYPMVAPNYSKQRSALAKAFGLGRHRAKRKR